MAMPSAGERLSWPLEGEVLPPKVTPPVERLLAAGSSDLKERERERANSHGRYLILSLLLPGTRSDLSFRFFISLQTANLSVYTVVYIPPGGSLTMSHAVT